MIALLAAAIALGLAGAGHCITMCGGVVGMVCGVGKTRASYVGLYNLGRVLSYGVIGAIAGAIGESASAFPFGDARILLRIVAGVVAVVIGLHLCGVRVGAKLTAPIATRLRPVAAKLLPLRSAWHALALGAIWGWMPCGMVYGATVIAVATGSIAGGALAMTVFGLGTLPVMLAVGTFATRISSVRWLRLASGSMLILSGLWWGYGIVCAHTQNMHGAPAQIPVCAGHARGPAFALHANHDEGTNSGR